MLICEILEKFTSTVGFLGLKILLRHERQFDLKSHQPSINNIIGHLPQDLFITIIKSNTSHKYIL